MLTALVLVAPLPQGATCSGELHIEDMTMNVYMYIIYCQFKDAGQTGALGLTVVIVEVVVVTSQGHVQGVVVCPSQE